MSGLDLNFGSKANPTKSQQKQESVAETSLAKQLQFGSPQTQNVLATAQAQGNTLGANPQELEFLNDMSTLSDREIEVKHGRQAVLNRGNYLRQMAELEARKAEGRTMGEQVGDVAIDVAQGAGNVGLGAMGFVNSLYDWANQGRRERIEEREGIEITPLAETTARTQQSFNEAMNGWKSEKRQEQDQQAALERSLDVEDRKIEFSQQADQGFLAQVENEFADFGDILENMSNNPNKIGEIIAQGVGSMLPITASVQTIAKANIVRKMGQEAAEAFLKTSAGKAALTTEAAKLVPAISAITEGGSSGIQARQEILNMTPEELMESPEYARMLESGLSPEKAQSELARLAGQVSELSGATIGMIAGRISARFEAAPGSAGSLGGAVKNVGLETVEEGIQEVGNTVSANAGVKTVGFDQSLVEGTGEALASGMIGGAGTAGVMQAPSAALNTIAGAAKMTSETTKQIVENVREYRDTQEDKTSATGSVAMKGVRDRIEADADVIINTEPQQTTPEQTTEEESQVETFDLDQTVRNTVFLSEKESAGYAAALPNLAGRMTDKGLLSRGAVIEEAERIISAKDVPDVDKLPYAIMALDQYDSIQAVNSDENNALADSLSEDDSRRQRFRRIKQDVLKLNSSNGIVKAQKLINNMSPEDVKTSFADGFAALESGNKDDPAAQQTLEALSIMARKRPDIVEDSSFDEVFEQIKGDNSSNAKRTLNYVKESMNLVRDAEAEKERIFNEQEQAFEKAGKDKKSLYRSKMQVRDDIYLDGNKQNKMLSVTSHSRKVLDALNSGRLSEAQDAMEDLRNFGQSQIAKMGAFNTAAQEDVVNANEGGVSYQAFGPFKQFFEQQGVWFNRRAPESVALARDVHVDTTVVAETFNALLKAYPELSEQEALVVPKMHTKIRTSTSAPIETDPVPVEKPERRVRKDAVSDTSLTDAADPEGQAIRDRIAKKAKARKKKAYERKTPRKRPFIDELLIAGVTLDPEGSAAKELFDQGFQKRDMPGLIRKGGRVDVDTVEYGSSEYLNEVITAAENDYYYDRQAILDAIISEASGVPVQDANEIALAQSVEEKEQAKADQTTPQPTTPKTETKTKVQAKPEPEVVDVDKVIEEVLETETTQEEAPVEEVTDEQPKTLKEALPDLIEDQDGKNHFLNTFSLAENKSSLLFVDSPIETAMREATGLTAEQSRELEALKNDTIPAITKLLNQTANEAANKERNVGRGAAKRVTTWLKELFQPAEDVLGYRNAMSLNLARETEDGLVYDQKVVEAFTMAAMKWVLKTAAMTKRPMEDSDINKRLGRNEDAHVTTEERAAFNFGPSTQSVIDDISNTAMQLMGVKADKTKPIKFSQGIFRSMAANMIEALEEGSWIQKDGFDYKVDGDPRTFYAFRPNMNEPEAKSFIEALIKKPDLFDKVFLTEPEREFFIGEAPKGVANTVTRQGFNKTSSGEKKIMNQLNNTANKMVLPMFSLWDAVGDDVIAAFAGKVDFDPETTNKADAVSKDSTNKAITNSMKLLERYREDINAYADENGLSEEEVESFFKWTVSSVGRLQQEGPITPQGDKVAREMISSTFSTLNLNNQEHVDAVWLAAAQALGMKVEKKANSRTIEEVQEVFKDENGLMPVVDLMQSWFTDEDGAFQDPAALVDAFRNAAKTAGVDMNMKSLHAAVTVARMQFAIENQSEDMTAFETSLAFEADGKTDGPINALMNAGYGAFTPHQIKVMAKGGMIISGSRMTLNRYIEGDQEGEGNNQPHNGDRADLYEVAADMFRNLMTRMMNPETGTPPVLSVMNTFLDGFVYDGEQFTIGRNLIKNPLTVFLYGSGSKGISSKMASAINKAIHEKMSDMADQLARKEITQWDEYSLFKENPDLVDSIRDVMGTEFDKLLNDPVNQEINQAMTDRLVQALQETIAEPLEVAIDKATGGLKEAMVTVRRATQIQGIAFQDAYEKAIERITKERGKKTELSENDYMTAFEEASQVAPIYRNSLQEFHIAANEKYSGEDRISYSLTDALSSGATIPMPADVGVKGQPYLVIGTGDGKMIMNILAPGHDVIDRTLMVFDGVEIALDNIKAASGKINESVWQGWREESVTGMVHEGFSTFLRQYKPETFSKKNREALNKLVKDVAREEQKKGSKKKITSTRDMLNLVQGDLMAKAMQNRARKAAIARMNVWIDHMAGAESSFENQGEIVESDEVFNPDLIAAKLNEFYNEERAKLWAEIQESQNAPTVQEPTKGLMDLLKSGGLEIIGTGVIAATGADLSRAITKATGASKEQHDVFKKLVTENKALEEYTFYFGSSEELDVIREEKFGLTGQAKIEHGAMYPNLKAVFIANAAPETMLHEAIHVATVDALKAYYADKENASEETAGAMTRLENLMGLFRGTKFNMTDKQTAEDRAGLALQGELDRYEGNPVRQMAEFLAWSLSNQNLIENAKKTTVWSPVQKIAQKALQHLKELLGLKTFGGRDMFSKIRFNTEILILDSKRDTTLEQSVDEAETKAAFEQVYGQDNELTALENKFHKQLQAALEIKDEGLTDNEKIVLATRIGLKSTELTKMATKAVERLVAEGFKMNHREKSAFMTIHSAMMSGMVLNPAAKRKAYDLYSHMIKVAQPGSIGALVGKGGIRKNKEGQSDLLASFVALGLVHKPFKNELKTLTGPRKIPEFDRSIDGAVRWLGETLVNLLTQSAISRKRTGPDINSQLMGLSDALASIQDNRRSKAEALMMRPQEYLDEKGSGLIEKASKSSVRFLKKAKDKTGNKYLKHTYGAAELVASVGSAETSELAAESIMRTLNDLDGWQGLRSAMSDLIGVTASNEPLVDLINKVKAAVDGMRQDYRENIPKILAEKFSRKLTKNEWTQLYEAVAQTDLVALGNDPALTLLKDLSQLPAEIRKAEALVDQLGGKSSTYFKKQAEALADWMVDRKPTTNDLLRNAYAIARQESTKPDPKLIEAIDDLTSLYALNKTNQDAKDAIQSLAQTEPEGMKFLIGYQATTKKLAENELAKEGKEREISRLNGWKGYALTSATTGHSLRVVDDIEGRDLERQGYQRVGDYVGDARESYRGTRGYYLSTLGPRSQYRQGVAQTVHSTFMGVDPKNGYSRTGDTVGYISGAKAVRMAKAMNRIQYNLNQDEILLPVRDENNEIVAFERTIDPKKKEALQEDKHMGRVLGAWSGRIIEEQQSHMFNKQLIMALKKIYDEAKTNGDTGAFINVADPKQKDAVIRDAWETMGDRLRQEAFKAFGTNVLMVRKDMVDDALGFHQASVRDAWTGVSRWSPETQKEFTDTVRLFTGNEGYKWLVRGENLVTGAVSYAKTTIVIRSLVVIRDNILSNNLHLMMWGIGPVQLAKGMRAKFIETNQYLKNQERIIELNAEMAANLDNRSKVRRIEAELQVLEDANKNLSIKPLLDAGEFSTVSESLTEADVALREGKMADFLENATDKLPEGVKGLAKNFVISKDTELFQGLNRAVQYGDFVAKAVLYDHLMKEKGYSQKQALDVIKEEFVNYNRLAGRGRDYLESVGLLWFWNYKIRIMKVLTRTARERPASFLMWSGLMGPMLDLDTAASGSVLGAYAKDSLGYAIGPEMGINSLGMNPWMNLME